MKNFIVSPKFSLNEYDWKRWLHNASVFMVPVALLFLAELVKLVPDGWQYGALALYLLNVLQDIVRKWASENTYRK